MKSKEYVTVYTEYIWDCPSCGHENKEDLDYEEVVQCAICMSEFEARAFEEI